MESPPPSETLRPSSPVGGSPAFAAALVLLPTLVLALGILAWSPYPRIEGTGLAFLAALPAGLLVLSNVRRARARQLGPALVLWLVFFGALYSVGEGTDGLGRTRALVLSATGLWLFLAAFGLDQRGRVTLAAGLPLVGLAFGLVALALGFAGHPLAFAGVLGNPGALNQVLVPAGAAAIALLTRVHGRRTRMLAGAALSVVAIHSAAAPVHAGLVALVAVALVVTLLSTVKPSARVVPFGIALVLGLLFVSAGRRDDVVPGSVSIREEPGHTTSQDVGGRASGMTVRLSIARASLALWRHEGAVGAGQFQAAIPPYRTVEETERSRDGVCQGGIREVEHPHDDWLLGFVEGGLLGGGAWIALLAWGGWAALRSLRRGRASDAALGAALFGLLINALAHGPLLISPASSALGFALLGAVIAFEVPGRSPSRKSHLLGLAAAVFAMAALALTPGAWTLWQHGRGLTRASEVLGHMQARQGAGPEEQQGEEMRSLLAELESALDSARRALPDSALLLRMEARFSPALVDDAEARRAAWEGLLVQQPHSFEALWELGLEAARQGDDETARAHWETALALQPTHPVLLRNLARLAFHGGDETRAQTYVLEVQSKGCLERGWMSKLGAELVFAGRTATGRALMAREDTRLVEADAAWLEALGQEAKQEEQPLRADALSLLANLTWAREHAEAGSWSNAVRLYRQALNRSRRHTSAGATTLRLEFAAALWKAGERAEARTQAEDLEPGAADLRDLAPWARNALEQAGLIGSSREG